MTNQPTRAEIGPALRAWYRESARELPWRRTHDPYAVWISEAMLQQTQVATVIDYWQRWMERFPTVESLATASEDDVLHAWQGLGYYRRARNLRRGAQAWVAHGMPQSVAEWREIPGIGPYTAGAIASIAQGHPAALVDGNVARVYARLSANPHSAPQLERGAWAWAEANVDPDAPGEWNQALMELGATVCRPIDPQCPRCPISSHCAAFQSGRAAEYPVRAPKMEVIRRHSHIWVPVCGNQVGITQSEAGSWWAGMWGFPRANEESELTELVGEAWPEWIGRFNHTVTRYRITVEVSLVRIGSRSPNLTWVSPQNLGDYPMPSPQHRARRLAAPWLDGSLPQGSKT